MIYLTSFQIKNPLQVQKKARGELQHYKILTWSSRKKTPKIMSLVIKICGGFVIHIYLGFKEIAVSCSKGKKNIIKPNRFVGQELCKLSCQLILEFETFTLFLASLNFLSHSIQSFNPNQTDVWEALPGLGGGSGSPPPCYLGSGAKFGSKIMFP